MPNTEETPNDSTSSQPRKWGKAAIIGLSAAGVAVLTGAFVSGIAFGQVQADRPSHSVMAEDGQRGEHQKPQGKPERHHDRDHDQKQHDMKNHSDKRMQGERDRDMRGNMPAPEQPNPTPSN